MILNSLCKSTHLHLLIALAITVSMFGLLTPRVAAIPPQYAITDLGIAGENSSHSYAVNASGSVLGDSGDANGITLMEWIGGVPVRLDQYVPIPLAPTLYTIGTGINGAGQVSGYAVGAINNLGAVRWTGAVPTVLPGLANLKSVAYGINDSGQVAGYSLLGNSYQSPAHAVRWTGTTLEDLGTLGGAQSQGFGINNSGQVAGWAQMANGASFAVRWTGTTAENLGSLSAGFGSQGYCINASGEIAGISGIASNPSAMHATRWTGTLAEDLGTLGGSSSYPCGLNDLGDVTGMSYTGEIANNQYVSHPFLYTEGMMYDLTTLLLPGSNVTGLSMGAANSGFAGNNINDLGQIAAWGTIGGQTHALLLTPTPEPSSALLLGSGAMLLLRRRRPAAR